AVAGEVVERRQAAVQRADPPQPIGVPRAELLAEDRPGEHEAEEDAVADEQGSVDAVGDELLPRPIDSTEEIGDRLASVRPPGRIVGMPGHPVRPAIALLLGTGPAAVAGRLAELVDPIPDERFEAGPRGDRVGGLSRPPHRARDDPR